MQVLENANGECSKITKKSETEDIDSFVWKWFQCVKGVGMNVSGPMVQDVASRFANSLGKMEFQATSKWLECFRKRYDILFSNVCGSLHPSLRDFAELLPIVCKYEPVDIFNGDEICLFFKALPSTKFPSVKETSNGEMADQRMSILITASAEGEKLPLLVIGNSKYFSSFNKLNMEKLKINWYTNSQSWMTTEIFKDWLTKLNRKFQLENRRILLIIKDCSAHKVGFELSNISIMFMPVNTQPVNQGVAKCLKFNYRKCLLKSAISRYINGEAIHEIVECISIPNCVTWLVEAWNKIDPNVIIHCFEKAKFPVSQKISEPINENDKSLTHLLEQGRLIFNFPYLKEEEYVTFDDGILSSKMQQNELLQEEVIEREVRSRSKPKKEESIVEHCPSTAEVINAMKKIKYFTMIHCPEMLSKVSTVEGVVNKLIWNNRHIRQSSMKEFIKRF